MTDPTGTGLEPGQRAYEAYITATSELSYAPSWPLAEKHVWAAVEAACRTPAPVPAEREALAAEIELLRRRNARLQSDWDEPEEFFLSDERLGELIWPLLDDVIAALRTAPDSRPAADRLPVDEAAIRADEREACAKIADSFRDVIVVPHDRPGNSILPRQTLRALCGSDVADAIRARLTATDPDGHEGGMPFGGQSL